MNNNLVNANDKTNTITFELAALKVINEIKLLAEKNSFVSVVWLYGSQAKGNASKESDYDLAIAFNNLPDEPFKVSMAEELSYQWSKETDQKISIVNINQAPVPLALNVINDGVTIFSNNDLRLHSEEARVWSLWEAYRHEYARK